jgi:hypothetical protein
MPGPTGYGCTHPDPAGPQGFAAMTLEGRLRILR